MLLVYWWRVVVVEKFARFVGRASRAEYWWFFLANLIIVLVLGALSRATVVFTIIYAIYGLALIIPSIAVGVRRLHDTSRSGWWILIGLVPIVGFIILIVFFALDGDPGPNRFGPPPPRQPALA
jgi:uncharacterized membrane protein YhaH (DUF805 family)